MNSTEFAINNTHHTMALKRQTRSDKQVKTVEKELGIKLYKPDGKKQPAKKTIGKIREEQQPKSEDQKIAAKRTVKSNPKVKASTAKMVNRVISAAQKNSEMTKRPTGKK